MSEAIKLEVETMILEEVHSQDRRFLLQRPLEVEVINSADGWSFESKPLSILAFGRSKQEAFDSFAEDFAVLWDAVAEAPQESLTWDAIAVKRVFQELVSAVSRE